MCVSLSLSVSVCVKIIKPIIELYHHHNSNYSPPTLFTITSTKGKEKPTS